MAANTYANGSGDGGVEFDKPVGHLNVYIAGGVTFSISLDNGTNFLTLPAGFHSFRVGPVKKVIINSDGDWELVGVQE